MDRDEYWREIAGPIPNLPKEERAKIAALAAAELATLRVSEAPDHTADLISALRYAPDASYRHLIEPFLRGPNDFLAEVALKVLCFFYGLTHDYAPHNVRFMEGVPWDRYCDLQSTAIFIAGYYLRDHSDPELLGELVRLVEDETGGEERRLEAYRALLEALQAHKEENRVTASRISSHVLTQARERLVQRGG